MTTFSSTARLQELLPQLFQPDTQSGDRYLKLDITADLSALIALENVQESVWLPNRMVTPLPNLSPCILGVMNARNQVLCVVDLAQALQVSEQEAQRQHYPIVIVRLDSTPRASQDGNLLAFKLHRIQGIVRLNPEDIASPADEFSPSLTPFLRGCVLQDGQLTPVLDLKAVATAPSLVLS